MASLIRCACWMWWLGLAACQSEPVDTAPMVDTSTVVDTATTPAPPPCVIPLRTVSYGHTDRYFVEVEIDGETEMWQLDTGSGLTFRFEGASAPAYTPEFGTLDAGCGPLPFAGRNLPPFAGGPDGATVTGLLGMDLLLQQPMVLEVDNLRLLHRAAPPDWPDAVRVPFDDVASHALVPVELDGTSVRLMFDTGGGHTLWVGQEGGPDDEVQLAQDAEGTIFPIWSGTGELELGPLTRTIPVDRAPEFPYFEETVDALGGDLHGLLGVTAFPGEALYFHDDELWIGPLAR